MRDDNRGVSETAPGEAELRKLNMEGKKCHLTQHHHLHTPGELYS